ncbi:hypothetical protein GPALN_012926 [Globodera pallida]|nr:hypothetical protein GPALN_012926 [Globodera pallida]
MDPIGWSVGSLPASDCVGSSGVSLEVTLATKPGGDDNDGHLPRQYAIAFGYIFSPLDDFARCFDRPDDAEVSLKLCRPVQNEWSDAIGNCPKCNQISVEGFAKYLNPANWVRGINSVSDALILASDIFGYLAFPCSPMSSPCRFGCPSVPSLGKDQKKLCFS